MPEIKIENLSFSYNKKKNGGAPILSDLNVVFPSNEVSVIVGPSGCGKTTLLKTILGLEKYEGNIYFDDILINNLSIKDRGLAYVNQNITLFEHLTAFENIAFPLKLVHASADEIRTRIKEVAELLHIESCLSRLPRQLSLGQCQRVSIAKALIKRPLACVFDEPFSNLDEPIANELIIELRQIFKKMNTTVIFVSHSTSQSFRLADKLYVMDEGNFVASGTPDEVVKINNERVKEILQLGYETL